MKKIFVFVVSMLVIFSLTGCASSKTVKNISKKLTKKEVLTCTKQEKDSSGLLFDQKVDATFVNNKVTDLNLKIDITIDDSMKSYAEQFKSMLEEQYKSYSDNGAKVEFSVNDNIITINMYVDVDNMTEEQLKELDMADVYGTKTNTLKSFEKEGYTCK